MEAECCSELTSGKIFWMLCLSFMDETFAAFLNLAVFCHKSAVGLQAFSSQTQQIMGFVKSQ